MKGLNGKIILVTGATSGIGKATALRFVKEGARVVVHGRNPEKLAGLAREVPGLVACLQADVADPLAVAHAFETLMHLTGRLDVLVNNAGISFQRPFLQISRQDWDQIMQINLSGAFYVAQQAARIMQAGDGGVILNMASTNGLTGYARHSTYNTSKAGLINLTRSMALELAPRIRVNAICPGMVKTPLLTYADEMAQQIPLKRLGRPEEIAALCAFLASDEAQYITGQCIVIDGGETAGRLLSA
jgi:NAD(P)-dependent dehydrogenase (short-subunit alcohol dehydrogenase family)